MDRKNRARRRIERRAPSNETEPKNRTRTRTRNRPGAERGRRATLASASGREAVGRGTGRGSRGARAYLAEELPGLRLRLRKRRGEHGRARGRAQALARRQPGDRGTQRHVSVRASRTTPSRQSRARPWRGGLRDCDVRCRADDTNPSPNPRARTVRRVAGRCLRRDAGSRREKTKIARVRTYGHSVW